MSDLLENVNLSSSQLKQNFGLTSDGFDQLLNKLRNGDEALLEKIFLSQFVECKNYLINQFNIDDALAYDCTMESLLKLRKRLISGKVKYGNMRYLFTKMAQQFLFESKSKVNVLSLDHLDIQIELSMPKNDIIVILNKAWASMCHECTKILGDYYYNSRILKNIADELGTTETTMRKRKQRCLEKLRNYFNDYFKDK